ncbi:DUF2753 family protein [Shewanella sp. 10N.286.45.A1]|uniref:DUF2753 family protein n=1 Tax=Shewanella sp. 10N.286.45.A1 TaxID=3229694 RepID=UPI00354BD3AB
MNNLAQLNGGEMENWQQLMNSGNQHFKEAAWLDAQYCYQQAVSLIESEWSHQLSDRELLFAWIAGMHNLAHLYESQQQSEMALHYLKHAHKQVQTLSADESVIAEVRSSAFNSLSLTIPPLLDFAKRHPICDDCVSALEETAASLGGQSSALH